MMPRRLFVAALVLRGCMALGNCADRKERVVVPEAEKMPPDAKPYHVPDAPTLPPAQGALRENGDRVFFAKDSDVVNSAAAVILRGIVHWFDRYCPTGTLTLEGHADETGSRNHNRDLSRRRALAVARFLLEHDVDPEKTMIKRYGALDPAVLGHDEVADQQNRRVVIVPHGCPGW